MHHLPPSPCAPRRHPLLQTLTTQGRRAALMLPLLLAVSLPLSSEASAASPRVLLQKANRGDTKAMRQVARMLWDGTSNRGVDRKNAVAWWKKAADAGDTSSMLILGDMHANGHYFTKNPEKAKEYYREAQRAGNSKATQRLAAMGESAEPLSTPTRQPSSSVATKPKPVQDTPVAATPKPSHSSTSREVDDTLSPKEKAWREKATRERELKTMRDNAGKTRVTLIRKNGPETMKALMRREGPAPEANAKTQLRRSWVGCRRSAEERKAGLDEHPDEPAPDTSFTGSIRKAWQTAYQAVGVGDIDKLTAMLAEGAPINATDSLDENGIGDTLLQRAVACEDIPLIKLLLEKGADPHIPSICYPSGTPGHAAIDKENLEILRLLLDHGMDPDACSYYKKSLLHYAIDKLRHQNAKLAYQMAELLLERGADPNLRQYGEDSPMTCLLNPHQRDSGEAELRLIKLLISYGAKDKVLHNRAEAFDAEIVLGLLEWGYDPNITDASGNTALHATAMSRLGGTGRNMYMEHMLAYGGDINKKNAQGWTPLHCALYGDGNDTSVPCTKMLILNGANIHDRTNNGSSILHTAVTHANSDAVAYILTSGVDINLQDANGQSALHRALLKPGGNYNISKITKLLNAGLDITLKTKGGQTALHLALIGYARNTQEVVTLLLEKGADLNACTAEGYNALHLAVLNHDLKFVQWLVEQGANVNAKDKNGKTALDLAREKDKGDIARYLRDL